MVLVFLVLIIAAAGLLGFIILVQNPKGGGLVGNVGGFGNQFMGVKQTTDVLEKGTWIFAGIIAVLCLVSSFFMKGSTNNDNNPLNKVNTNPSSAPAATSPQGGQPVAPAPAKP